MKYIYIDGDQLSYKGVVAGAETEIEINPGHRLSWTHRLRVSQLLCKHPRALFKETLNCKNSLLVSIIFMLAPGDHAMGIC